MTHAGHIPSEPRAHAPGRAVSRMSPLSRRGKILALVALAALARPESRGAERTLDVGEFRVEGVRALPASLVERTLTPHLGPSRNEADVEAARAALEKAYHDNGYQTVTVVIPPQSVERGVVLLRAEEGRVGRLRVKGARYHDPKAIREAVPSLAEGSLPDFRAVQEEIVALQTPDLRVTPAMRPGAEPGTVDVDLQAEDKLPLHGSVELNNRRNPDTKPLRVNGDLRYDNLWQAGHSAGVSFQTAPQRVDDAQVLSGYYLARLRPADPVSLMLSGTKQDSDVNTLGDFNVSGRGKVVGLRALFDLPAREGYYHSASLGVEYKSFDTDLSGGGSPAFKSPITYFPLSAGYTASRLWTDGSTTQGSLGATWHLRGLGDGQEAFDAKRMGSSGGFIYLRGELSHLQKLPEDFEFYTQAQGQLSPDPLVSNEQFGIGGLSTVRGYFESEAVGDNALGLSAELRTPSFTLGGLLDEWRLHVFAEWAGALLREALPGQQARYEMASAGVGTRVKLLGHLSGSLDVAAPLIDAPRTKSGEIGVIFTVRAEF